MAEVHKPSELHVIGVTGGVGAGKSTAAKALVKELRGTLLDADEIVTSLFENAQVLENIEVALSSKIRDTSGRIQRDVLANLVFNDSNARHALEGVLHPAVRHQIWLGLENLDSCGHEAWAILDVPLLREGGLDRICDFVVHVAVPEEARCARACARHGWNRAQWQARENAQIPEIEKASLADAILDNRTGIDSLYTQVQHLVPKLHCLPPRSLEQRWPFWDQDPPT